ncbi:cytochrome c oxidase assembly protein [Nocardioidaceae bacterium]|nr:cytochrome c oxidase assembly protein [Nocardioidaceae bacterium]
MHPGDDLAPLPPLEGARWLTGWTVEPWVVLGVALVGGLYLLGVRRLRARGDRWPLGRSAAFVLGGLGLFVVATMSSLATYDTTLLSVHMIQHMILSMAVPIFLALGAPVTLALRTLPPSPRRLLLTVLHSRVVKVLSFPPLVFALYVLSPWALYFTGWYDATLHSVLVHELMHIHLVVVGSLFFWPLLGLDPVPGRVSYPLRLLLIFLTLPFHAFLGVTIMGQSTLVAGQYYPTLPMAWLPDAYDDQRFAGALLWGSGDLVALLLFAVFFTQWVRSSMAEARREDRRLDRIERREAAAARGPGPGAG